MDKASEVDNVDKKVSLTEVKEIKCQKTVQLRIKNHCIRGNESLHKKEKSGETRKEEEASGICFEKSTI